jgi:tetratricopeptide (TPR) repeat protein
MQRVVLRACPLLLLAVAAAAAAGPSTQPSQEYVKLCEAIANLAQAAGRAFNSGDVAGAQKMFGKAEAAYKQAVALSPNHPYAFMNYGNALSNANRFEESLEVLAAAMERLDADADADAEAVAHVKGGDERSGCRVMWRVTPICRHHTPHFVRAGFDE